MPARAEIAPLTPLRQGAVAAEILAHDGDAEIIAVFERCFYVAAPGGIICVGLETLGDGPLHVLLSAPSSPLLWPRLGIVREAKGWVRERRLGIGAEFTLDLRALPVWQPPAWMPTTAARLRASLADVLVLAAPLCPAEGLSCLVIAPGRSARDRTADAAAPLVRDLHSALQHAFATSQVDARLIRGATLLIGLGPGLTPSGDDLLGGVFLTMSALGTSDLRETLWAALSPELDLLTVEISSAHLAAAADGIGAATVHAALNALLSHTATTPPQHLEALRTLGHSSGFDTLAGIVLTLEAALAAAIVPA